MRDHAEAASGLAGARRLDGRVQRQQPRLARDVADQRHDLADARAALIEALHRGRRRAGERHRLAGDARALGGAACDLVHGGVHLAGGGRDAGDALVHVGGRDAELLGIGGRARRPVVDAAADLGQRLRRLPELLRGVGDLADAARQRIEEHIEVAPHVSEFVARARAQPPGQIAAGGGLQHARRLRQRCGDRAHDRQRQPAGQQRDPDHGCGEQLLLALQRARLHFDAGFERIEERVDQGELDIDRRRADAEELAGIEADGVGFDEFPEHQLRQFLDLRIRRRDRRAQPFAERRVQFGDGGERTADAACLMLDRVVQPLHLQPVGLADAAAGRTAGGPCRRERIGRDRTVVADREDCHAARARLAHQLGERRQLVDDRALQEVIGLVRSQRQIVVIGDQPQQIEQPLDQGGMGGKGCGRLDLGVADRGGQRLPGARELLPERSEHDIVAARPHDGIERGQRRGDGLRLAVAGGAGIGASGQRLRRKSAVLLHELHGLQRLAQGLDAVCLMPVERARREFVAHQQPERHGHQHGAEHGEQQQLLPDLQAVEEHLRTC